MLPEGWEIRSLAFFVSSLDAGVSVNSEDRPYRLGEVGVLKTSAVTGSYFNSEEHKAVLQRERHRVRTSPEADSIIVSRMNTPELVGESAYVDKDYPELFLPDRLWLLRFWDRNSLSVKWLSYVLCSERVRAYIQLNSTGTSGSMKNLPKERFLKMRIVCPPLFEQRQIVETLDTVDEAITHTSSLIAKLKQMKAGLLHDLLTRGLDENGELRDAIAHPEQFKDSPLGQIPREWETGVLGDVVDPNRPIVYGILMPGYGYPGGIPVVKVKDIINSKIQTSDLLLTSPEIDNNYRRSRLEPGDLLFTIRGTVGRMAFVPEHLRGANITQDTARLAITNANPRFVRQYLEMPKPQAFIELHTIGQAVKGINLRDVRLIPLVVPPTSEQLQIIDICDTYDSRIHTEEAYRDKLKLQKQGLMHDLLTGKVRLKDA